MKICWRGYLNKGKQTPYTPLRAAEVHKVTDSGIDGNSLAEI
jgi:hypothetical protein